MQQTKRQLCLVDEKVNQVTLVDQPKTLRPKINQDPPKEKKSTNQVKPGSLATLTT